MVSRPQLRSQSATDMGVHHNKKLLEGRRESETSSLGEDESDSSESDSGLSMPYSEDDLDDTAFGTMARFVPTLVLERLRVLGKATLALRSAGKSGADAAADAAAAEADIAETENVPKVHELDAAVMVVDVSGFSGMCERFAQGLTPEGGWKQRMKGIPSMQAPPEGNGSRRVGVSHASVITSLYRLSNDKETKGFGAEGVRDALNSTLGGLISTVERHGGDVMRIAGDALIVLFHQGAVGISPDELTDLCLACTRCGWDCATSAGRGRSGSGRLRGGSGGCGGGGLSVHVGVGCGRVRCFHVGSEHRGWQLVVSGELFQDQVAKALQASCAGEVVVSAEVWQLLAGTGWGSGPADRTGDIGKTPPSGLRLLHWTPDPGGGAGAGCWDDGYDSSGHGRDPRSTSHSSAHQYPVPAGGGAAADAAPAHGGGGALAAPEGDEGHPPSPISKGVKRRSSYSAGAGMSGALEAAAAAAISGVGTANSGGGGGGAANSGSFQAHGRASSLDNMPGSGTSVKPGGRWCPSRRRLALLEEVETGVLTMLSKEVGRALKSYCPQPIREGLVAERLGLLAELQRVAVLFVGLSFEGVGNRGTEGDHPRPSASTRWPGAGISSSSSVRLVKNNGKMEVKRAGTIVHQRDDDGQFAPVKREVTDMADSALGFLQASFALLQSIVAGHGGVIKELSVDDKGTVMVAGFGLSPHVGHLPAARATLCAMECTDRLRARGLARCHAGIATGPVFCGSLGSEDRREFAMISETVNLAQRLMSARKDRRLLSKTQAARNYAASPEGNISSGSSRQASPDEGFREERSRTDSSLSTPSPSEAPPLSEFRTSPPDNNEGDTAASTSRWSWDDNRNGKSAKALLKSGGVTDDITREGARLGQRARDGGIFPLTPAAHRKTVTGIAGGRDRAGTGDVLEEPFNRWVVLEGETMREARKTSQLAFLELEAIKVKGKTSKVVLFAPGLANEAAVASIAPRALRPLHRPTSMPASVGNAISAALAASTAPSRIIMGGGGGRGDIGGNELDSGKFIPGGVAALRQGLLLGRDNADDLLEEARVAAAVGANAAALAAGGDRAVRSAGARGVLSKIDSLDESKRYRLELPERGDWGGGEDGGEGGVAFGLSGGSIPPETPSNGWSGSAELGQKSEPHLSKSLSLPGESEYKVPHPDVAARGMESWRRFGGKSIATSGEAEDKQRGERRGLWSVDRSRGALMPGSGSWGRGRGGEDVLSREAFEALLPCIFHADAVHDEVSHILWARTGGRVAYMADLCRSLVGVTRRGSGGGGGVSFGDVGEDGTWRLRLNEFAHVLKLASRVPTGVEGSLQRRLDELPYAARQVVLRAVCVTVVGGVGEVDLLLHLLTNVTPFKQYWEAVVLQHRKSRETPARRRGNRRRSTTPPPQRSRSILVSPIPSPNTPQVSTSHKPLGSRRKSLAVVGSARNASVGQRRGNGSGHCSGGVGCDGDTLDAEDSDEWEDRGRSRSDVPVSGVDMGQEEEWRSNPAGPLFGGVGIGGVDSGGCCRRDSGGDRAPPARAMCGSKRCSLSSIRASSAVDGAGTVAIKKARPGLEALQSCLQMLEAGNFLRVCAGGETFICDDVMLIDQVYASTPFKLRKALHKEAAKWISDRHRRSFRDRADIMPVLISHLTQAHEEARAQAMLAVLKVLGGRFLDRWVLEHVRPMVAIRENPRNPTASEHLALCVLPALPSLRGLSKAIRGAEIAGVVVGVALRLRSLRFKGMDKTGRPSSRHRRSNSISSAALKATADLCPSGGMDRSDRAHDAVVKRRSASLAGRAVRSSPQPDDDGFVMEVVDNFVDWDVAPEALE